MEIKNIKINSYGNLKNKEIELKNKINIIYGKNESGKSTLFHFIKNIFYGISKNKNGKEISDYEKYLPWTGEEFSGKIKYSMQDGKTYEIFRDFHKKNPKIYNENLEEISKEFSTNKKDGNQFFYEQTKIDENTFSSTVFTMQQEIKLGAQNQAMLIQKIANLTGTGDDTISYKKIMEKLNKKQLEEIGTQRSQEKPLNKIEKKLKNIQIELEELKKEENKKYENEIEKNQLQEKIKYLEIKNTILKKLKMVQEKNTLEKEKIEIKEKLKKENIDKIKQLKNNKILQEEKINQIEKNKKEILEKIKKNQKKKIQLTILYFCILILSGILPIIFQNNIALGVGIFIFILTSIIWILQCKKIKKENQAIKNIETENIVALQNTAQAIETEIQILENATQKMEEEIQQMQFAWQEENRREKENIEKQYVSQYTGKELSYLLQNENIDYELEENTTEYQQVMLQLHTLELEKQNRMPRLERLVELQEEQENLEEQRQLLLEQNMCIEIAKECLQKAYEKMRNSVTPKLIQNVSKRVEQITGGKYPHIYMHTENEIRIENQDGTYIPIERLSIGTIDQIYLSLRLAMIEELSEEILPIMLDETFAYYDDERLKNILYFLAQEVCPNQVLIFSCSKREQEILENLKIPYHLVEI